MVQRRTKMKVNKITIGFVVQVMDPETGAFVSQEFVASDDVTDDCDESAGTEP